MWSLMYILSGISYSCLKRKMFTFQGNSFLATLLFRGVLRFLVHMAKWLPRAATRPVYG